MYKNNPLQFQSNTPQLFSQNPNLVQINKTINDQNVPTDVVPTQKKNIIDSVSVTDTSIKVPKEPEIQSIDIEMSKKKSKCVKEPECEKKCEPKCEPEMVTKKEKECVTEINYGEMFKSWKLYLYVFSTFLALLLVWFFIGNDFDKYFDRLTLPNWVIDKYAIVVIWLMFKILLIYVAYRSNKIVCNVPEGFLSIMFYIHLALLVIWAVFFYTPEFIEVSRIIFAILFFQTLLWLILVFPEDKVSGILLILYLIWLSYIFLINLEVVKEFQRL